MICFTASKRYLSSNICFFHEHWWCVHPDIMKIVFLTPSSSWAQEWDIDYTGACPASMSHNPMPSYLSTLSRGLDWGCGSLDWSLWLVQEVPGRWKHGKRELDDDQSADFSPLDSALMYSPFYVPSKEQLVLEIYCSDLTATCTFYTDVLGFKAVRSTPTFIVE